MIKPEDLRTKAIPPTREAVATFLTQKQEGKSKATSTWVMIAFVGMIFFAARAFIDQTVAYSGPMDEPAKPGYIFSPVHRLTIRAIIPKRPRQSVTMMFETAVIIRWETRKENHVKAGHAVFNNWKQAEAAATGAFERYSRHQLITMKGEQLDQLLDEVRVAATEELFPDPEIATVTRIQFSGAGRFREATPKEREQYYNVASASYRK